MENVNGTIILQPNFSAKGITRLDLDIDLSTKTIIQSRHNDYRTKDLIEVDTEFQLRVDEVVQRYAPDADRVLGHIKVRKEPTEWTDVVAQAAYALYSVDAVLLDPLVFQNDNDEGPLTQQAIYTAFEPERQKPNTPGFSAFYQVSVSGVTLSEMRSRQPEWSWLGVEEIAPEQQYSVILGKAALLNPDLFFDVEIDFDEARFVAEVWETVDAYSRQRTSMCRYVDVDEPLPNCEQNSEQ